MTLKNNSAAPTFTSPSTSKKNYSLKISANSINNKILDSETSKFKDF